MKTHKSHIFVALATLLCSYASAVQVIGTNFDNSGHRLDVEMTVISSNSITPVVGGGMSFQKTVSVLLTNGVYSINLLPGGYTASVGKISWGFIVPDTTNVMRMTDLISANLFTNTISYGTAWGTRVSSNDPRSGFLAEKIVAGTNASICVATNTDGSFRLIINADISAAESKLLAANESLQSGIVTTSNVFDSAIASVSNNAALQIKQTSNAAISAIYTTNQALSNTITATSNSLAANLKAQSNAEAATTHAVTACSWDVNSLFTYGDSIAFGKWSGYPQYAQDTGIPGAITNSYVQQVCNVYGATNVNFSSPGWTVVDQQSNIFSTIVTSNNCSIYALGANDCRMSTVSNINSYSRTETFGQIAWLAIPEYEKIRMRSLVSGSNSLIVGSWNTAALSYSPALYTFGAGKIVVSNVIGDKIVIGVCPYNAIYEPVANCYIAIDGVTNTWKLLFAADSPTATGYPKTYKEAGICILGAGSGSHTVEIGQTNNGFLIVSWLSSSGMWTNTQPVMVMEVTSQSSDYPWGGSEANITAFNRNLKASVSQCQQLGLPVYWVPTRSVFDTSLLSDGIHPNSVGHSNIARLLLQRMSSSPLAPIFNR